MDTSVRIRQVALKFKIMFIQIINPDLLKSWELYAFIAFGILLFAFPKKLLFMFRFMRGFFLPKKEEKYPLWSEAPKNAKHLAQDDDGIWRWHVIKPKLINGKWVSNEFAAMHEAGYTKDTANYVDSLQTIEYGTNEKFGNTLPEDNESSKNILNKNEIFNKLSTLSKKFDFFEYKNRHGDSHYFVYVSKNKIAWVGDFEYSRLIIDNTPRYSSNGDIIMLDPVGGPYLEKDMLIGEKKIKKFTRTEDEKILKRKEFSSMKNVVAYIIELY